LISEKAGRYLYVGAAAGILLLVVPAFTRTYWAPLARGNAGLHPAIHLHSVLFFAWVGLFLAQTILPLRKRIAAHRGLGLAGIALAALMVLSGLLAAVVSLKSGLEEPRPHVARTAAALSFGGMLLFSTFMIAGISTLRRPAWHKRLMVLATLSILQAAIARWIMLIPDIGQPTRILIGAVIVDVLLLTVAWVDTRAQGRLHPAWAVGGALILCVQWIRIAILPTAEWLAFTNWLAQL
jgi:hypothetical protein